jgi:hypothetical protein
VLELHGSFQLHSRKVVRLVTQRGILGGRLFPRHGPQQRIRHTAIVTLRACPGQWQNTTCQSGRQYLSSAEIMIVHVIYPSKYGAAFMPQNRSQNHSRTQGHGIRQPRL